MGRAHEWRMRDFLLREVNILIEFNVILAYSSFGVFRRSYHILVEILFKKPSKFSKLRKHNLFSAIFKLIILDRAICLPNKLVDQLVLLNVLLFSLNPRIQRPLCKLLHYHKPVVHVRVD
jgi:hypothetical protein